MTVPVIKLDIFKKTPPQLSFISNICNGDIDLQRLAPN